MKKIITFCVVLLLSLNIKAQDVASSGVGYREFQSWSADMMAGLFLPLDQPLTFYNFGVYPRYNVIAPRDYFSVSAGFPLNAGFQLGFGSVGTIIQIMTDIPAAIDINFGARATSYNSSLFGAFVGVGMDYNFMNFTYNSLKIIEHTVGPMIHGGFRWKINGRETGLRISYTKGFGSADQVVNGIIVAGNPGNRILSFSVIYGLK